MGWAWYLANEMQFYIIAPAILFTAYRYSRVVVEGAALPPYFDYLLYCRGEARWPHGQCT